MSAEEELSADLKSLAAELAKLVPSGDRLKRDRLLFLAGQASVGANGQANKIPAAFGNRSIWPAAFAVMTSIAAALMAIVLLKPPQIVERIVEVPIISPDGETMAANPRVDVSAHESDSTTASARQDAGAKPGKETHNAIFSRLLHRGSTNRMLLTANLSDPRALDKVLDEQFPSATNNASSRQNQNIEAGASTTYRELLESMIDNPDSGKPKTKPPVKSSILSTLFSGANS
jgi:hypothetical protein